MKEKSVTGVNKQERVSTITRLAYGSGDVACIIGVVCGIQNSKTAEIAYGTAIHKIYGLAFPHFDFVLLTKIPMITSDDPSKTLETSITIPTIAGEIPT